MITLKLGTPEWQVVWDAISAYVENGRADSDECCKQLAVAEKVMREMDQEMASLSSVAREHVKRELFKVILTTVPVRCRPFEGQGRRYRAKLTARGTWTEMYKSKPCSTEEEARALAEKYLAKNADRMVLK